MKNLAAAFGKWRVADETIEEYTGKLSRFHLAADQWNEALDRIEGDFDNLPSLKEIYPYLKEAQRQGKPDDFIALAFTIDGKRHILTRPVEDKTSKVKNPQGLVRIDPSSRPELPEQASEVHLVIPHELEEKHAALSRSEARAAFVQGFVEAGGNLDQVQAIFDGITRPEKPKRESHKSELTHVAKG